MPIVIPPGVKVLSVERVDLKGRDVVRLALLIEGEHYVLSRMTGADFDGLIGGEYFGVRVGPLAHLRRVAPPMRSCARKPYMT